MTSGPCGRPVCMPGGRAVWSSACRTHSRVPALGLSLRAPRSDWGLWGAVLCVLGLGWDGLPQTAGSGRLRLARSALRCARQRALVPAAKAWDGFFPLTRPLSPCLPRLPTFQGSAAHRLKPWCPAMSPGLGAPRTEEGQGGTAGAATRRVLSPRPLHPDSPWTQPVSASGLTGADGPSDPPCLPVTVWTALLGTTRDEPHRMGSETRSVSRP